jgi:hypothetical protein
LLVFNKFDHILPLPRKEQQMATSLSGEELDRMDLRGRLRTLGLNLYVSSCKHGLGFISEARDKRSFPIDLCQERGACPHQKSCMHVRDWATSEIKVFFGVNGYSGRKEQEPIFHPEAVIHPKIVAAEVEEQKISCQLPKDTLKTMAIVSMDINRNPREICKNSKTCSVEPCRISEIAEIIPLIKRESNWD